MKLYSDIPQNIPNLNFIDIKEFKENGLILIFNDSFEFNNLYLDSFIITTFESNYSDFEISNSDEDINSTITFFIDKFKNEYKRDSTKNNEKINFRIKNIDHFEGIYVNSILLKEGSLRFFSVYEIFLSIFKESFTGILNIERKGVNNFKLYFNKGRINSINSNIKENSFQYFLKEFGYISKVDKNLILYPIEKQIDDLIEHNNIFFSEREHILKDYMIFLLKRSFEADGFFNLKAKLVKDLNLFDNYYNFLSNFINFSQKIENISYNQIFKLMVEYPPVFDNKEIDKLLHLIKSGADFQAIKSRISSDSDYSIKIIDFLIELGLIEFNNKNQFITTESNSLSTIEKRVEIWLSKIKDEDYFSILGVSLKDNSSYIEKKYKTLINQFIKYLSSKEINSRFHNEIKEIIFELDSAYNVLSDDNLKEKYYNNRL